MLFHEKSRTLRLLEGTRLNHDPGSAAGIALPSPGLDIGSLNPWIGALGDKEVGMNRIDQKAKVAFLSRFREALLEDGGYVRSISP